MYHPLTHDDSITDEDIFAYVYTMLHDPAYHQKFEIDLRREFPASISGGFCLVAGKGRELLDLHPNFETVEPWPLEHNDVGANDYSPLRAAAHRIDAPTNAAPPFPVQ